MLGLMHVSVRISFICLVTKIAPLGLSQNECANIYQLSSSRICLLIAILQTAEILLAWNINRKNNDYSQHLVKKIKHLKFQWNKNNNYLRPT